MSDPQKSPLPARWEAKKPTLLQRMCVLRCLRPGKITLAVQDFVTEARGLLLHCSWLAYDFCLFCFIAAFVCAFTFQRPACAATCVFVRVCHSTAVFVYSFTARAESA